MSSAPPLTAIVSASSSSNQDRPAQQEATNLPDDVLIEIFEILVPYHSQYHYTIDTTLSPWSVSQVCQSWRKVATSTPRLWCHIGITMNKPAVHQRDTVYLVQLALERAQDHLLSIRFHDDLRYQTLSHAIQQALVTRSHVWKQLDYKGGDLSPLQAAQGRLDRLESLCLSDDPEIPSLLGAEPPLALFAVAPHLRVAKIRDHTRIDLPWAQLEFYEASDGRPTIDLLRCPRLINYSGPSLPSRGDIPAFTGNFRHSCLTHLAIFSVEGLQRLEAPTLTMLKIAVATPGIFVDCADFVRRSQCRLNIFGLGMLATVEDKAQVVEFLRICPSITELHLMWVDIAPAVLDTILGPLALISKDVQEDPSHLGLTVPLVPKLTALNFDFRRTHANADLWDEFDQSGLIALFESRYYLDDTRWHGTKYVDRLEAVIICTQASARSYEVPEFGELTDAGFCLLILEMDEYGRPIHDLRQFYLDPDPDLETDEDEEEEEYGGMDMDDG
ncbi:hypothetical protein BDN72DRAFT_849439 [Pluteus cervinus]|uniref:Uncharacterized protein n=1 Tax=Pluteus cervinus TaxID=181527 RepID=A0ACD3A847_9AGAR|nr:hypothetical protein BDN72DRAFT_849439 [Pluteus cervinus]